MKNLFLVLSAHFFSITQIFLFLPSLLTWMVLCVQIVKQLESQVPDMLGMLGRIYKDKFTSVGCTDMNALDQAIIWYRKGFEVQPNEYAGVNLATLMVVRGEDFRRPGPAGGELTQVLLFLNNAIGKKGDIGKMTDYWDVATFFEIKLLMHEYSRCVKAAVCMYNLNPPTWYLKSTLNNTKLIVMARRRQESEAAASGANGAGGGSAGTTVQRQPSKGAGTSSANSTAAAPTFATSAQSDLHKKVRAPTFTLHPHLQTLQQLSLRCSFSCLF